MTTSEVPIDPRLSQDDGPKGPKWKTEIRPSLGCNVVYIELNGNTVGSATFNPEENHEMENFTNAIKGLNSNESTS